MGPESEISGSSKNIKPEKNSPLSKINRHIHVLVIPKFGGAQYILKGRSALGIKTNTSLSHKLEWNWNYLYFQASPSFHSIGYVSCCEPFFKTFKSSAGLVGCWNVTSVAQSGLLTVGVQITNSVNSPGWAKEKTFQQPPRPAEDVKVLTEGLQALT